MKIKYLCGCLAEDALYKIKETAISYITQLENHKFPEKLTQIYEKTYSLFIYFLDFDLFPFRSNVR